MECPFLNDDVTINILSRLSVKDLCASKCVSKRWNALISSASFLRVHYQRSLGTLSGLLFQQFDNYDYTADIDNNVVYISVGEEKLRRDKTLLKFLPEKEEEPEEEGESENEEEPEEEEESDKEEELSGDETLLDFLPEKVVVMSSCNGLLCCRNCIYAGDCLPSNVFESRKRLEEVVTEKLVVYVCNPSTKEWIAVRSTGSCTVSDNIGLAFYPFGCSAMAAPVFRLVSIQFSRTISATYSFSLYSSWTRRWAESKEVCHCEYRVLENKKFFAGTTFHWLTDNYHIVAFDVESELSSVIKLPGPEAEPCLVCLGSSEGDLYYVASNDLEVSVWMLRDYFKSEWVLKHRLTKIDLWRKPFGKLDSSWTTRFTREDCGIVTLDVDDNECDFQAPLAFYEHVLYMRLDGWLYSFDFRTSTLKSHCKYHNMTGSGPFLSCVPTVLPFCACLTPTKFLDQADWAKSIEDLSESSSQGRGKRRRRRNLSPRHGLLHGDEDMEVPLHSLTINEQSSMKHRLIAMEKRLKEINSMLLESKKALDLVREDIMQRIDDVELDLVKEMKKRFMPRIDDVELDLVKEMKKRFMQRIDDVELDFVKEMKKRFEEIESMLLELKKAFTSAGKPSCRR